MRPRWYWPGIAAFLLIAGCDALAPDYPSHLATSSGVPTADATLAASVELAGALTGDFYYTLSPLAAGDTFLVELAGTGGRVLVRHRVEGDGKGWLDVADAAQGEAAGVVVRYRQAETVLAEEAAGTGAAVGGETWFAGPEVAREPDSYHYEVVDGDIIVTVDYEEGSAAVRTLGSAWVQPTHVDFVVSGVSVGTPESVAFLRTGSTASDPTGFELKSYHLPQP